MWGPIDATIYAVVAIKTRCARAMAVERSAPQITALWQMVKMLNAVSGGLDFTSVPEADRPRAQWDEVTALAAGIVDEALAIVGDGMSTEQASVRLMETDVSDVLGNAAAYAGAIELTPPDSQETDRTLTVTVTVAGDPHRTLSVTADRGPAPTPRPHTAATLLRTAHHLQQLGATLGELVIEPAADGVPMCRPDTVQVLCEICETTVGGDVARTVDVGQPWPRAVKVCSVGAVVSP